MMRVMFSLSSSSSSSSKSLAFINEVVACLGRAVDIISTKAAGVLVMSLQEKQKVAAPLCHALAGNLPAH